MILFFDTETSGLSKNTKAPITDLNISPRLVQLAYLVYDLEGNLIHSCNEIADRRGNNLESIFELFLIHVKRAKLVVTHDLSYNEKVIGSELIRLGLDNFIEKKERICTMESTTDLCKIEGPHGYEWPKLEELFRYLFKDDFKGSHDALLDVQAIAKCFWELFKSNYFPRPKMINIVKSMELELDVDLSDVLSEFYPYRRKNNTYPYIYVNSEKSPVFEDKKDFEFSCAYPFEGELAIVQRNGYYGVINRKGEFIIRPTHESRIKLKPKIFFNLAVACEFSLNGEEKNFGVINACGHEIVPFEFSGIEVDPRGYIKVEVLPNYNGYNLTSRYKGLYKFNGERLFDSLFEDLGYPSENLCAVKIKGKWGFMNLKGENVIHPQYYEVGEFKNGYAPVCEAFYSNKNQRCGLINYKGNEIIPCNYSTGLPIDFDGKDILCYEDVNEYSILINKKNGKRITPKNAKCIYSYYYYNIAALMPFELITEVNEGLKHTYGYTNLEGDIIIEPKFQFATHFSEGLALVVDQANKLCFINEFGTVKIELDIEINAYVYELKDMEYAKFINGIIIFENDNRTFVVDNCGRFLLTDFRNKKVQTIEGMNYFIFSHFNGLKEFGLCNFNGGILIPPIYDSLRHFKDEFFVVSKERYYGIINSKNELIIDILFDYICCKKRIALKDNIWYLINGQVKIVENYKFSNLLKIKSNFNYLIEKNKLSEKDFVEGENFWIDINGWCLIEQDKEVLGFDNYFNPLFSYVSRI
jgi:hypothetical protein